MSPRLRLWGTCRALALRTRSLAQPRIGPIGRTIGPIRPYSDDANGPPSRPMDADRPSPSSPAAGNSSAEASTDEAVRDDSQPAGDEAPGEAGSTILDSYMDTLDDEALGQMMYGGRAVTSRTQDGGLTAAQEEVLYREGTIPSAADAEAAQLPGLDAELLQLPAREQSDLGTPRYKFDLPEKPYPEDFNLKKRYHPVLEQITRLLMRDGKLSVAQRNMAMVMNFLRTAPAPMYSPKFPLLPGTPPAPYLPLNPILYMTIAIDSVAPLIRVKNISGAAGGGRALEVPTPLAVRQRRRTAFQWILDVINKKPSKGSGRKQFPHRIAEEIIAVVEGRSTVWEKRRLVHRLGTTVRANVDPKKLKRKKQK